MLLAVQVAPEVVAVAREPITERVRPRVEQLQAAVRLVQPVLIRAAPVQLAGLERLEELLREEHRATRKVAAARIALAVDRAMLEQLERRSTPVPSGAPTGASPGRTRMTRS